VGKTTKQHQGSGIATEKKSEDFYGILKMRLQMNQGKWIKSGKVKEFFIFDLFCGDGMNIVDDSEISGSPLRIMEAIKNTKLINKIDKLTIVLSDIRKDALQILYSRIEEEGMPENVNIILLNEDASDLLPKITTFLKTKKNYHAILLLDPNGPKTLPLPEIKEFSQFHSSNSDIIINFNVVAFKRIFGHKKGLGCNSYNSWWIGALNSLSGFVETVEPFYKTAWLRKNMRGCGGWTILSCFGYGTSPKPWRNAGFLSYESAIKTWEKEND